MHAASVYSLKSVAYHYRINYRNRSQAGTHAQMGGHVENITGCLQIQTNQFPEDFQDTFWKKIPEELYATSHTITHEIIVILFTQGLPM